MNLCVEKKTFPRSLQSIFETANGSPFMAKKTGLDRCRLNIIMAQEYLDRLDTLHIFYTQLLLDFTIDFSLGREKRGRP